MLILIVAICYQPHHHYNYFQSYPYPHCNTNAGSSILLFPLSQRGHAGLFIHMYIATPTTSALHCLPTLEGVQRIFKTFQFQHWQLSPNIRVFTGGHFRRKQSFSISLLLSSHMVFLRCWGEKRHEWSRFATTTCRVVALIFLHRTPSYSIVGSVNDNTKHVVQVWLFSSGGMVW